MQSHEGLESRPALICGYMPGVWESHSCHFHRRGHSGPCSVSDPTTIRGRNSERVEPCCFRQFGEMLLPPFENRIEPKEEVNISQSAIFLVRFSVRCSSSVYRIEINDGRFNYERTFLCHFSRSFPSSVRPSYVWKKSIRFWRELRTCFFPAVHPFVSFQYY